MPPSEAQKARYLRNLRIICGNSYEELVPSKIRPPGHQTLESFSADSLRFIVQGCVLDGHIKTYARGLSALVPVHEFVALRHFREFAEARVKDAGLDEDNIITLCRSLGQNGRNRSSNFAVGYATTMGKFHEVTGKIQLLPHEVMQRTAARLRGLGLRISSLPLKDLDDDAYEALIQMRREREEVDPVLLRGTQAVVVMEPAGDQLAGVQYPWRVAWRNRTPVHPDLPEHNGPNMSTLIAKSLTQLYWSTMDRPITERVVANLRADSPTPPPQPAGRSTRGPDNLVRAWTFLTKNDPAFLSRQRIMKLVNRQPTFGLDAMEYVLNLVTGHTGLNFETEITRGLAVGDGTYDDTTVALKAMPRLFTLFFLEGANVALDEHMVPISKVLSVSVWMAGDGERPFLATAQVEFQSGLYLQRHADDSFAGFMVVQRDTETEEGVISYIFQPDSTITTTREVRGGLFSKALANRFSVPLMVVFRCL